MTAPTPPTTRRAAWYVRPAIVLPGVTAVVVLLALLTPQPRTGRAGSQRLSTYSTAPQGAAVLRNGAATRLVH